MFKAIKKPDELPIDTTIESLVTGMMETFNQLLRIDIHEMGYTKEEMEERIIKKNRLRKALRECSFAGRSSKIYIKDYIKDILLQKYKVKESNIDMIIPFAYQDKLTGQDKFEIMLYILYKQYQEDALKVFIKKYKLDEPKRDELGRFYYEINERDIDKIYRGFYVTTLTFMDKLNIITQRVYQQYKGNGTIDGIRDMNIDGVSAGVSGIPEGLDLGDMKANSSLPRSYNSIWIFFQGKSIHCSFLGFQSNKELIRVCKNIYRYNCQGQLSEASGYMVSEMMDGSRVAVARPPFAESWVLFVRKFDSVLQCNIKDIISDKNNHLPIRLIQWLVKGCQVIGITGEQGSGKTTLLISMIGFINPSYNLRIHELSYELHLRKIYPNRNIVSFRETGSTSGQEGLDFQKKTDGVVSILGEVASAPVSNWLVQMSMVASLFTLFTHHAKTTSHLVDSLRNALLLEGGFNNEKAATRQVLNVVNFDIHMKKTEDGHRYIERITEIIPEESNSRIHTHSKIGSEDTLYYTRDILKYEDDGYIMNQPMSKNMIKRIETCLSKEDRTAFYKDMEEWRWEVD